MTSLPMVSDLISLSPMLSSRRTMPDDHALDHVGIDRPLAQRDLDRAHQLVAIERHAPARSLDDLQLAQLHALESGETAAAIRAIAAPPDGRAVLGGTAVLHLGFALAAIGTAHDASWVSRGRLSPRDYP